MERKIGEIFEYNGEWYQCVEGNCAYCSIQDEACEQRILNDVCKLNRIFKKLEKVGEPTVIRGKPHQKFNNFVFRYSRICQYCAFHHKLCDVKCGPYEFYLEIKQNKEDMEEKNLKPFDLQKAREGKPVCTRDRRKARIICFDLNNDEYPIVAAVGNDSSETLFSYTTNGEIADGIESEKDLMMLPEKKEGWVNVYKDSVYDTKDEALIGRSESRGYIDTIKIKWEE